MLASLALLVLGLVALIDGIRRAADEEHGVGR
jgi:hypothetical protein